MYPVPDSEALISRLGLGLFSGTGALNICRVQAFWRRGSVEVVCQRHGIPLLDHLDDAVVLLRERIGLTPGR